MMQMMRLLLLSLVVLCNGSSRLRKGLAFFPRTIVRSPSITTHVHFDTDKLLSAHIATIERALGVTVHNIDLDINTRNLWGLLYRYKEISKVTDFYPEMFTIGYLLNETPGPIRFLLSLSLDPIVSATGDVAVLSLPASGNLYAILDVVKAYFEQNVFSAPIPDIHGIFIERPSGERLFQLQFLVRDKAAVKGDLMKLLGKFESLSAAGIEERIEDFSRFVNIFDSRPSSSLSSIFDTRPSLSHSKLQLSRLKEQQIQAHEPDTESTELVCSSSRLGSSFVRPPRVRRVPLSDSDFCQRRASRRHILPPLAIPTSTSNDLTVEDFPEPLTPRPLPNTLSPDGSPDAAKIHPAAPKKKQAGTAAKVSEFGSDSWLRMGHSNPHLGRKAFARLRDAMSVDSSSSDSSDNF